ncbi:zinc finger and BTB domain-containing protein 4 [Phyllopteryx taeniolatus]|uniref:zinc finger and BTB domain-containing protein 4 n=1 Tax=Phyllopteryx taeniolatus TaxID=161469 RepID=UPI002AD5224A|nr:zinc finger and BTB domain-containing protein 4 [Phyllopteryx taeniolatus]XP_061620052.1 zinc finger and BTB domain-containing protein 4 [Phyllopteryx taeniolatus]XP_061620053.1 zinc finger and BTB domain-containing protein 4 [Phyllopteryx taeniolatus]XP_061620054.1 zinc finger and BTB domain-containing protein 4 [Phyllopteryx taeniolatus]XP_061620055.1 zinc finger and BTB domain-containing protein 4 [Phyllopteryx taeniolatus]XP_061620056.1 zinc finger and BTB domain-containing protein 4 [P
MKGKRHCSRGDAMMEDRLDSMADGPKNAKITLSFPVSAGPLPASLTSSGYCRNAASSSSPHRRRPSSKSSDEGSLWKLDSTMDVKHRPFKPPRHDSSPSSSPSSSSSPMTVHALIRKDIKSPPPLKCSKLPPETQFHKSAPASSSSALAGSYGGDGWDERHKAANGAASPSQTAQILFSLGTSAYPRGGGDAERKEKITGRPAGKLGSPRGPSLHPPALHLPPPLPPPPPPPSEGLTAPPHSSSYSPTDNLKPELICGVCHRLFSSASSLTVHMRLHRGSRALSCRFCGKVFIHSKRLQSHEASCRVPGLPSRLGPSLAVQPKEEPLEEGEVRVEEGETDMSKARPEKKAGSLSARVQGEDDAAAAELLASDESHFVKVVDGNVIYFCSVCERSYMTLSSLKRHSNVHSWRRRYPCHYCDKVFALAEYRTKHEVWHTGERRYQCIFCWDAFATYYNLKTHQKTIHGINPSLISSEKTANGGYKQKANALKLYRLLPMRSQKRPYKTYSDTLQNGLLMSPAEAPSLSLPGLGCDLGPGDLPSFISGTHPQSVKPDPDGFCDDVLAAEHNRSASPPFPQQDSAQLNKHDEAHELEPHRGSSKMSSSSKTKSHKAARGADSTSMPSVITYGHTKPSVIVHGTAVSSSVIVHSNQLSPGGEQNKPPEINVSQTSHKVSARPLKRQRDGADGHRKRSRDSSDPIRRGAEADGSCFKSRKSHSKNDLSRSKQPSPSAGSLVKETGPLCQITVRIGEEAIVKRSISETDLRRDKSRSPPKNKRGEASSVKAAHHHKHHDHRRASQGQEDDTGQDSKEEVGENTGNSCDELREYNFRQKVREQESDHDMEDNLWRPYYSYKPKKKAQAHLQRFKSWQRKLKFKRALRLKRRAEKLKKCGNKEMGKSQDEEEEGGKPSEADKAGCEREEKQAKEACHELSTPSPPSPKPLLGTSVAPTGLKRRPWTNGNAAECATCGCWFSSTSKRDQHELSHLLEFVCLFCRATFPSRDKLEDHQRIQHPKPADTSAGMQKVALGEHPNVLKPECGDEKEAQLNLSNSSPARLSRRALSRHTCPQCHKVCKTSSALNRHIRRHEFSSSPEREKEDDLPEPETTAESKDEVREKGQVVSVISYLTAEPPKSCDSSSSPDHHGEPTSQHRQAESGDKPEVAERTYLEPERKPSPKISESPVDLAPAKAQPVLSAAPNLQSVLVMNRPECLDFCTPGKRNLDKIASPVHSMVTPSTSANVPMTPQTRITTAAPPIAIATVNSSDRGVVARDGVIMDRERQARSAMFVHGSYKEPPLVQALRVQSLSRSPSPNEAQDLTMSSILARERETERQRLRKRELEKQRERGRDKDRGKDMERVQHLSRHEQTPMDQRTILVPKEEPLSPVPSPQHIPTLTTTNGPLSHRHTPKSPCRPGLLAAANHQIQELDRLTVPSGGDRPSAHALLLPRAPKPPEPERHNTSRDGQHVEPAPVCYPVQDYPLPLLVPDAYQPAKKQEDNLLVSSYPAGALPFGPLGKMMVPNGADLAKLPFYPDPYQLLYGSQFLAYPYNVAALPVALNMMAPGADKVEPLPFLPAIFNYTAGAGPYMGAPPHPLVAKPSFYGGGKKQRDGGSSKP